MDQNALLALLGGGGLFYFLSRGSGSSGQPDTVPPIVGGAGVAPGASGTPMMQIGTGLVTAVPLAAGAVKAAVGGAGATGAGATGTGGSSAAAAAPEEIAITTIGGVSVGFVAVLAVWVLALVADLVFSRMIIGAKWVRQRVQELNGRAIPNMYENEFAMLQKVLDAGGYTYEISTVRDARFDWSDKSQSTTDSISVVGFRKLLRNIKYQGQQVSPTNAKYLMILARLLNFEYAYWLAEYGKNLWNNWGDPSHPAPNYTEGVYFDEIWNVPFCNGQPNDTTYDASTAAFEAVIKPGLLPFHMMKLGMQAQAIMDAANTGGGDGGLRGQDLRNKMGLGATPGVAFGDTTVNFSAPTWGQYGFAYDFVSKKLTTEAPK